MLLDEPETNRQDLERRLLTGVEYFENRIADDHLEGDDFNEDDSEDD
jgi:hypothetical protein